MDELKQIRDTIKRLKLVLDYFNGNLIEVNYEPLRDLKEKKNYPIEFQIFMEEIGELNVGTDQLSNCIILVLEKPGNPLEFDHQNTNLYLLNDPDGYDEDTEYFDGKVKDI